MGWLSNLFQRKKQQRDGLSAYARFAPIGNFGVMDDVVQELTNVANVDFERFDLSTIRTFDEFQSRAIDLGGNRRTMSKITVCKRLGTDGVGFCRCKKPESSCG